CVDREIIQQCLPNRIDVQAVDSDIGNGSIYGCLGRNPSAFNGLRFVTLPFVEEKEEGFVLNDRPADIRVELVIMDWSRTALTRPLAVVGIVIGEIVVGVADPAVIDPGCPPVPTIRAALHIQQNWRSTLDAELRRRGFLYAQFFDRIWWKRYRGYTKNACLV